MGSAAALLESNVVGSPITGVPCGSFYLLKTHLNTVKIFSTSVITHDVTVNESKQLVEKSISIIKIPNKEPVKMKIWKRRTRKRAKQAVAILLCMLMLVPILTYFVR